MCAYVCVHDYISIVDYKYFLIVFTIINMYYFLRCMVFVAASLDCHLAVDTAKWQSNDAAMLCAATATACLAFAGMAVMPTNR